jgi:hypothetical protein
MMRHQPHPAGTFPACPDCGIEPRHILDQRARPRGGHLLNCACGDCTKHDDLAAAAQAWGRAHQVQIHADLGTQRNVRRFRQPQVAA